MIFKAASLIASGLRLPLHRELETLAGIDMLYSDPVWTDPPMRTDNLPVLLVGGMAAIPLTLMPITEWLRRIGCQVLVAPTRLGIDCGERTTQMVLAAMRSVSSGAQRPPLVIAHSRGGQFARAAVVRAPQMASGLITLGSPLNRLLPVHPLVLANCAFLGLAGTVGVPGLMRAGCLSGRCCRQLRADLVGPFPDDVPFTSVYSKDDGVVRWQASLDAAARNREVSASHSGLILDPATFRMLAEEIDLITQRPRRVQLRAVAA